jgi:cytoskeletal protein CcmA (bactofilin family)
MSIFSNKPTGREAEMADSSKTEDSGMRNRNGTESSGEINIVGKGVVIDGNLHVTGDVRIGGRINGEVRVENRVVVAPEGIVVGGIFTEDGDLAGCVEGDVTAKGRLIIRSTASILGKVAAAFLTVEEGAALSGRFEVGKPSRVTTGNGKAARKPETPEQAPQSLIPME